MKNSFFALILCLAALLSAAFVVTAQDKPGPSGYHLLTKIEVGGDGGWDYLFADADSHRLYVSHGTKVEVIDTQTDKKIAEIGNLKGIHGIAIAGDLGRGFISDGRDNSVTIFDTKTNQSIGQVKTGTNPDSIIYDPASKRVFAFNGGSKNATAIDAATGNVAGTIDLGGKPEFATANDKGMVFVNIEDKSEVVAIDSKALVAKAHWTLAPDCDGPSGMAIDLKNHLTFSVCDNKKMVVLNTDTGKIVGSAGIGQGTDAAGFDEKDKLAFASNGEGTLTVVREDSPTKFEVVESVTTQSRARTMTLDSKTHKVYLSTAQFGPAPAPTTQQPRPRAPIIPNSFVVLVFGK